VVLATLEPATPFAQSPLVFFWHKWKKNFIVIHLQF
jgi:hypothetical protein